MMKHVIARPALVAAASLAALSACSGGRSSLPATPVAQSTPTAASQPASKSTGATLTIVVPQNGAASATNRRRPKYVSPSSTALTVSVNGGTATTYGLTPNSPGCQTLAGSFSCTFTIVAPVGNDALSLAITDGAGKTLSRNTVTAAVAAGVATPVSVTLSAVPASVVVVPGQYAVADTQTSPYDTPGLNPVPVEVEALDADGNVIVGPGAPTLGTVSVSANASYATIASAGSSDTNAYTLKANDGSAGGKTVTVTASVRGITLADGTTSPVVTGSSQYRFTPAIAIGSGPGIFEYSIASGTEIAAFPVCGGGCGGVAVNGLASDSKGDLYASYDQFEGISNTTTLDEFAPGGTSPAYTLGTAQGTHKIAAIYVDPHDTLYVANGNGSSFMHPGPGPSITNYTYGATSPIYEIDNTPTEPGGIAVDASGNVFVSDPFDSVTIEEYAPKSQTVTSTLSDSNLVEPTSLAFDKAGGLYVADPTNEDIAYFAKGSTTPAYLSDGSFGGGIDYVYIDPEGNLWVGLAFGQNATERFAAASLPNTLTEDKVIPNAGAPAYIP